MHLCHSELVVCRRCVQPIGKSFVLVASAVPPGLKYTSGDKQRAYHETQVVDHVLEINRATGEVVEVTGQRECGQNCCCAGGYISGSIDQPEQEQNAEC